MVESERRNDHVQLAGDVGEIKGTVKGIEKSLATFIKTVEKKHGEQDEKIKGNAEAVAQIKKKVDRFTGVGAGIGGTLAVLYGVLVIKGEPLRKAIANFFGGDL